MEFGVISTAAIARDSVIPAVGKTDHEVGAVASRSAKRAEDVAAAFDIPRWYGSYEALLADEGIDAVYNPLPNGLHVEWTKRAADRGLDVFCEKPLGADAAEAREAVDHCADRGVTLMEGFMYRFHPRTDRALDIVRTDLGDVRSMSASFKFPLYDDPDDVRLDPDLAGGSVMDVGCYAVNAARLFLGEPDRVRASTADTRDCGVDTEMAGVLEYDTGEMARVASGFDTQHVDRYRVDATDGWLVAEPAFGPDPDESVSLTYGVDGRTVTETFDPVDHYALEVDHFAEVAASGARPRVDAADTLNNMAVIDAVYESAERGEAVEPDPD